MFLLLSLMADAGAYPALLIPDAMPGINAPAVPERSSSDADWMSEVDLRKTGLSSRSASLAFTHVADDIQRKEDDAFEFREFLRPLVLSGSIGILPDGGSTGAFVAPRVSGAYTGAIIPKRKSADSSGAESSRVPIDWLRFSPELSLDLQSPPPPDEGDDLARHVQLMGGTGSAIARFKTSMAIAERAGVELTAH